MESPYHLDITQTHNVFHKHCLVSVKNTNSVHKNNGAERRMLLQTKSLYAHKVHILHPRDPHQELL